MCRTGDQWHERRADYLHVDAAMLRRPYVAVVIEIGSRRAYLLGVTDHPTGAWATGDGTGVGWRSGAGRAPFQAVDP